MPVEMTEAADAVLVLAAPSVAAARVDRQQLLMIASTKEASAGGEGKDVISVMI